MGAPGWWFLGGVDIDLELLLGDQKQLLFRYHT